MFRYKWSINQPIIAGRRKRSTTSDKEEDLKQFAELLEAAYSSVVKHLEENEERNKRTFVEAGAGTLGSVFWTDTDSS